MAQSPILYLLTDLDIPEFDLAAGGFKLAQPELVLHLVPAINQQRYSDQYISHYRQQFAAAQDVSPVAIWGDTVSETGGYQLPDARQILGPYFNPAQIPTKFEFHDQQSHDFNPVQELEGAIASNERGKQLAASSARLSVPPSDFSYYDVEFNQRHKKKTQKLTEEVIRSVRTKAVQAKKRVTALVLGKGDADPHSSSTDVSQLDPIAIAAEAEMAKLEHKAQEDAKFIADQTKFDDQDTQAQIFLALHMLRTFNIIEALDRDALAGIGEQPQQFVTDAINTKAVLLVAEDQRQQIFEKIQRLRPQLLLFLGHKHDVLLKQISFENDILLAAKKQLDKALAAKAEILNKDVGRKRRLVKVSWYFYKSGWSRIPEEKRLKLEQHQKTIDALTTLVRRLNLKRSFRQKQLVCLKPHDDLDLRPYAVPPVQAGDLSWDREYIYVNRATAKAYLKAAWRTVVGLPTESEQNEIREQIRSAMQVESLQLYDAFSRCCSILNLTENPEIFTELDRAIAHRDIISPEIGGSGDRSINVIEVFRILNQQASAELFEAWQREPETLAQLWSIIQYHNKLIALEQRLDSATDSKLTRVGQEFYEFFGGQLSTEDADVDEASDGSEATVSSPRTFDSYTANITEIFMRRSVLIQLINRANGLFSIDLSQVARDSAQSVAASAEVAEPATAAPLMMEEDADAQPSAGTAKIAAARTVPSYLNILAPIQSFNSDNGAATSAYSADLPSLGANSATVGMVLTGASDGNLAARQPTVTERVSDPRFFFGYEATRAELDYYPFYFKALAKVDELLVTDAGAKAATPQTVVPVAKTTLNAILDLSLQPDMDELELGFNPLAPQINFTNTDKLSLNRLGQLTASVSRAGAGTGEAERINIDSYRNFMVEQAKTIGLAIHDLGPDIAAETILALKTALVALTTKGLGGGLGNFALIKAELEAILANLNVQANPLAVIKLARAYEKLNLVFGGAVPPSYDDFSTLSVRYKQEVNRFDGLTTDFQVLARFFADELSFIPAELRQQYLLDLLSFSIKYKDHSSSANPFRQIAAAETGDELLFDRRCLAEFKAEYPEQFYRALIFYNTNLSEHHTLLVAAQLRVREFLNTHAVHGKKPTALVTPEPKIFVDKPELAELNTHLGQLQPVVTKLIFAERNELMVAMGIKSAPDFYQNYLAKAATAQAIDFTPAETLQEVQQQNLLRRQLLELHQYIDAAIDTAIERNDFYEDESGSEAATIETSLNIKVLEQLLTGPNAQIKGLLAEQNAAWAQLTAEPEQPEQQAELAADELAADKLALSQRYAQELQIITAAIYAMLQEVLTLSAKLGPMAIVGSEAIIANLLKDEADIEQLNPEVLMLSPELELALTTGVTADLADRALNDLIAEYKAHKYTQLQRRIYSDFIEPAVVALRAIADGSQDLRTLFDESCKNWGQLSNHVYQQLDSAQNPESIAAGMAVLIEHKAKAAGIDARKVAIKRKHPILFELAEQRRKQQDLRAKKPVPDQSLESADTEAKSTTQFAASDAASSSAISEAGSDRTTSAEAAGTKADSSTTATKVAAVKPASVKATDAQEKNLYQGNLGLYRAGLASFFFGLPAFGLLLTNAFVPFGGFSISSLTMVMMISLFVTGVMALLGTITLASRRRSYNKRRQLLAEPQLAGFWHRNERHIIAEALQLEPDSASVKPSAANLLNLYRTTINSADIDAKLARARAQVKTDPVDFVASIDKDALPKVKVEDSSSPGF